VLFVRLALGSDEKVPSSRATKPPWAVALPVLIATGSFQAPADAAVRVADGDASRAELAGSDPVGVDEATA
jgi:hypothetical protein